MAKVPYTGSGGWRRRWRWINGAPKCCGSVQVFQHPRLLLDTQSDWLQVISELEHNAIVKPAREGSSIGMRRVQNSQDLQRVLFTPASTMPWCLRSNGLQGRSLRLQWWTAKCYHPFA